MQIQPRVLIVDDNEDLRMVLEDLLASHGYATVSAANASSAIEIVEREEIPVGIIDLMLPDMNGLEIIAELKKRSYAMECIVLTAYASQDSAIQAVRLGAYGYIQKPYEPDQLLVTVQRALEKRIAEEERKGRMAELERLNRELKTTQAELVQSGKLSVIGQMAAEMAHEINNPIHTIRLHVGALKRRIVGKNLNLAEAREAVDAIDRSVNLITQVITRMRYFSKRSDEQYTVIDINAVIADSLKMLRRHLKKESIKVEEHYAPSPLTCFGNSNMLEQLFTNLILNARDALMEKKEGERTVTIETHRPKDDSLSVVIRDDGPGMDEDSRSQLFSPFFTTKPDGVGLGLAVVKRIVESHMGNIEVTSAPDEGTSFTITFPKDRRREPKYDAPE